MLRLNVREHELEISHSQGEKLGERDVFGNSSFSKSHSDDSEEGLGQRERERCQEGSTTRIPRKGARHHPKLKCSANFRTGACALTETRPRQRPWPGANTTKSSRRSLWARTRTPTRMAATSTPNLSSGLNPKASKSGTATARKTGMENPTDPCCTSPSRQRLVVYECLFSSTSLLPFILPYGCARNNLAHLPMQIYS